MTSVESLLLSILKVKNTNTKFSFQGEKTMKKLLFTFALLLLSVNSAYAIDISLEITPEAKVLIGSLRMTDDFTTPSGNISFAYMKYNNKTITFQDLEDTSVTPKIYDRIQVNKTTEFYGQCVSFVKAVTNYSGGTSTWVKGSQVTPTSNIPSGTAIALFSKNGGTQYNAGGIGAHTGIILGITSSYIWILDQNWKEADITDQERGTMGIHKIYFTNKNYNKGDVTNAYAYFVIDKL